VNADQSRQNQQRLHIV